MTSINCTTTRKFWLSSLLAAGGLLLIATSAQAGFRVDNPEQRPTTHPGVHSTHVAVPDYYALAGNRRLKYVVRIGKGEPQRVKGFGTAIPLNAATELIMPDHWLAYIHPLLSETQPVSWQDDGTWLDVLRGIAIRKDLRLFVDFNNEIVRIDPMPDDSALVRMADYGYEHPTDPVRIDDTEPGGLSIDGTPTKPLYRIYRNYNRIRNIRPASQGVASPLPESDSPVAVESVPPDALAE